MVPDDIVDYTVAEPGHTPAKGRYLATRRKDGFYFSEIKTSTGKIRKFVNPKHLHSVRDGIEQKLIDKAHQV